ncbi:MAG: thioesterase family protein [Deferrisoma sp.]
MVIETSYRVIYGDTDTMGVVYYGTYLRLFEIGRNEYMRARGLTYREVEERGIQLPVTEARCRYLRPARYDDLLTIATRVTQARGARVRFDYEIRSDDGTLLAQGHTEHGAVGPRGRPVRLPPDVLEALAAEEGQGA